MNERIEALKKLATKEVWRENQHNGSPEFDGSAPIQAHSKTEYKRLVVQGANVLPPDDRSYTIALQRAIEFHCDGKFVPPDVAKLCPYHAAKLNKFLAAEGAKNG